MGNSIATHGEVVVPTSSMKRRGWIHLAQSKSGNLRGGANLVDCIPVKRSEFLKHQGRHCVKNLKDIKYKKIWVWVLKGAKKCTAPFAYHHTTGAVIFELLLPSNDLYGERAA